MLVPVEDRVAGYPGAGVPDGVVLRTKHGSLGRIARALNSWTTFLVP